MEPVALALTDLHLHKDNIELVQGIVGQAMVIAKKNNIELILILGDIFESRKAQPLDVLRTFGKILELFKDSGIQVIAIPGNHCKVNYCSEDSYLSEYKFHPNVTIVNDVQYLKVTETLNFCFIPYFDEKKKYGEYLQKTVGVVDKSFLLFTHIGINGVNNNNEMITMNGVDRNLFNAFYKVYVGHFHNKSDVGENIHYIGAALQSGFSETEDKGFTIIYEDGSAKFIKSKFKPYRSYKINLEIMSFPEIKSFVEEKRKLINEEYVRIIFSGSKDKILSFPRNEYVNSGLDLKFKCIEREVALESIKGQDFIKFDVAGIYREFNIFLEENNIKNPEIGKKYLEKKLGSLEKV